MPDLNVITETRDATIIFRIRGGVDMLSNDKLERAADGIIVQRPNAVIVDLTGLAYINSLAIGVLARLAGALRRTGRVALVVDPGSVRDVFTRSRVIDLFEQYDVVDNAITAMTTPAA